MVSISTNLFVLLIEFYTKTTQNLARPWQETYQVEFKVKAEKII
jgi:hypothetical protein